LASVFKHNAVKITADKGVLKYNFLQIRQLNTPNLKRHHSCEGGNPSQFNMQLIVVNVDRYVTGELGFPPSRE